ncbi:DUF3488 and transglutaminase-like domain-containing protein [Ideonella sp. DXS22W]|uniref:DUF3488 and transglutaminase-like domain-containing protein n=1 Tax=Pseudaquabacterium inlustre TaxID=2984192 RepID=A0ABU9CBA0_9BURK
MSAPTPTPADATAPLRPGRWQPWRQWPRDTRDTLFQLLLIGWITLPHLGHLPLWCGALTALVLLWRAQIALRGASLPGRWTVVVVLGVAVALTLLTERTLLGREAGVTLLVVLLALKTLELRARRDAMVLFFLGFFLVLTNALYSQSLLTALAMLVATWGLLTALVLAHMPVGRPPLARAGRVALRSALLGLPVMAVVFVLFPRLGPLWGLPHDSVGRTGLSGSLRLGGVSELANDDSIAFRVRFDAPGGQAPALRADDLYFRGPVLSRFDGLEWSASVFATTRNPQRMPDLQVSGPPLGYELVLEPIRLPLLPLLEATPQRAGSAPVLPDWTVWQGTDLQWRTDRLVTERLRLRAEAHTRFQHGLAIDGAELDALRRLPEGYNPRVLAWARGVREQLAGADPRTLATAVMAQVRQGGYAYTLAPPPYGRDAIDEFWFDGKEGFCEHYATAFVTVMRAMGVPARVVTGYQGAEPPDADGWRIVRQSHAHAWAEYWQAGSGWLRADPTAAVAPERVRASRALPPRPGLVAGALRTMNPALADRLRRAWENLDNRWTLWVMGWSRTRQFDLLQHLGVPQPDTADLARALVLLLAGAASVGALWAWRDRHRQDPRQRLHGAVLHALQRAGVAARPHQPLRQLAAAVRARHDGPAAEAVAQALLTLEQLRYAPGPGPGLGPRPHGALRADERRAWRALRAAAARLPACAAPAQAVPSALATHVDHPATPVGDAPPPSRS